MEMDMDYLEHKAPEFEWSTFVDYISRFGYEHATEMLGMGGSNAAHEQNLELMNEPVVDYGYEMNHGCGLGVEMGLGLDMPGCDLHAD